MIDLSALKDKIPDSVYSELPETVTRFNLDFPLRLAHFMAQIAHESMNFSRKEENLMYSADRLLVVFPKYFNQESVKYYALQPENIANHIYSNRMGNGNESSGDGWKYRGRGYIQLTGKDNYSAFDQFVPESIIDNPELVAIKYPLLSAGWFWNSKNLNEIADDNNIDLITRRINGGFNGLEDRKVKFVKFYELLKNDRNNCIPS